MKLKSLFPLFKKNFGKEFSNSLKPTGFLHDNPGENPKRGFHKKSITIISPSSSQIKKQYVSNTTSSGIQKGSKTQEVEDKGCEVTNQPEHPSQGQIFATGNSTYPNYKSMTDGQLIDLLLGKKLAPHKLEEVLQDNQRAVKIRRMFKAAEMEVSDSFFEGIPYQNFDYDKVYGVCCENVIGYIPIPVGIIGPLKMDGKEYNVPMATTEGCLVASAQRGLNAMAVRGVSSQILSDGMTRAPAVIFPNAKKAADMKIWVSEHFEEVAREFNSTSNFARLKDIRTVVAGRRAFIRFKCTTGDAMGMNMVTKGVTKAMEYISNHFPEMEVISVSGNFCTDKKPSSINWTDGRGKSVVSDSVIPADVVKSVLKTTVKELVDLNISKNLIGSAMAGSIGGFNAHASNLVTAIYIACGQDVAQNVESSNCITLFEETAEGDLYASCTMPSVEVGTVGGGTHLSAQATCLDIVGCKGSNPKEPGMNSRLLARVVCSSVLAGELSLMAALACGDLLKSHMKLNRKK